MPPLEQFVPRYFEEILQDMVNIVRTVAPELTDFNIGSRIRTILEAAALEDDEQYHQMVALLILWFLDNVRGRDLDERLLEWNIQRLSPLPAVGKVIVSNTNLTTSFLSSAVALGGLSVKIYSSKGFPTTGTVRIGEGTASVEDVAFSANDKIQGILTVAPLTKDHAQNARVSLIEGASNIAPKGSRVRVRGSALTIDVTATLLEDAEIFAGDYDSESTLAIMDVPGSLGRVAAGAIRDFAGSPPFDGAVVRNDTSFVGGVDDESDDQFRSRGRKKIQSLSRSTPLSLEQLVIGEEYTGTDGITWRVSSSRVMEFYGQGGGDFVYLYIFPGAFDFLATVDVNTVFWLTNPMTGAEDGQKFFRCPNIAIVPGSLQLERLPANSLVWQSLVQNRDYYLHEGTGWIEILNPGLNKQDQLRVAQYAYYEGLLKRVQTVVNGVESNPSIYPGVAPAGVKVLVTYPRPKGIPDIRAAIRVREGYSEDEVSPLVADAISRYLTDLGVGNDIIFNELVERSMAVQGMYDIQFSSPTDNITILEDEALDLEDLDIIIS